MTSVSYKYFYAPEDLMFVPKVLEWEADQYFFWYVGLAIGSYWILGTVVLEQPKDPSHGELAIPVAFQLARRLKKPPIQIAQDIVRELYVLGEDFNVSRL